MQDGESHDYPTRLEQRGRNELSVEITEVSALSLNLRYRIRWDYPTPVKEKQRFILLEFLLPTSIAVNMVDLTPE